MDLTTTIRQAAELGHRENCPEELCTGPTDAELLTAARIVGAVLPDIFDQINRGVTAVVKAAESGHFGAGSLDATATGADELLREWFHWWRTSNTTMAMPGGLHVATVAYLAAQGVQQGRRFHSAADV